MPDAAIDTDAADARITTTDEWWLRAPPSDDGRVRIIASVRAEDLGSARSLARERGGEELERLAGPDASGVRIERTMFIPEDGGAYSAHMQMSADAPGP